MQRYRLEVATKCEDLGVGSDLAAAFLLMSRGIDKSSKMDYTFEDGFIVVDLYVNSDNGGVQYLSLMAQTVASYCGDNVHTTILEVEHGC